MFTENRWIPSVEGLIQFKAATNDNLQTQEDVFTYLTDTVKLKYIPVYYQIRQRQAANPHI